MDWAEVYRTTFEDLVRYLYRKVGDLDRAQDLAQEAFARALPHTPRAPRSWLFRIASNLARDEMRGVVRRKRHLALLKSEVTDSTPDPMETLEEEARFEAAWRAFSQLGERDQELLLLWSAGLSYQEIAAQTGLSLGAIGTTLARARRKLVAAYQATEERHEARG